ncbi:MAG: hypothetical protein IKN47_06920 [Lachnospiraceae bacterium]|nr:hypothetical protein [Lachnospiraceae bacterium]
MARTNGGSRSYNEQDAYYDNEDWGYEYGGGSSDSYSEGGSSSSSHSHSSSDSSTSSESQGGSKSHTSGTSLSTSQGGSNSQTIGQSVSRSEGGSMSQSQNVGGNSQTGYGKSWASGQVSDRTQQKFNEATQDYVRSQKVEDAYAQLQNAMNSKPTFQSKYEDKLNEMYNNIMNREAFTYDFNKDAMYQMYKDMYQRQGKRAMQDTMGQLAAMNNGYGSSYSQTAGQQAYQNYLQQLNDRIPELRKQALEEYDREGDKMLQAYNLTGDQYNREYGQYRDTVADWTNDRGFLQSAYQDERNFDYNQAMADRNFWQNEYWQEKNAEQSNINQSEGTNWSNGLSIGTNYNNTNAYNVSATQAEQWNKALQQSESDTSGTNWSKGYSQTHSEQDTDTQTEERNWNNTHQDYENWSNSYDHSIGSSHQINRGETSSWQESPDRVAIGSSKESSGSIPYSQSSSLEKYQAAKREADISYMSNLLDTYNKDPKEIQANQKELGKMIRDLLDNGTKSGKTTITYQPQDIANMLNQAEAMVDADPRNGSTYHMNNYRAADVMELYRKYGK